MQRCETDPRRSHVGDLAADGVYLARYLLSSLLRFASWARHPGRPVGSWSVSRATTAPRSTAKAAVFWTFAG